MLMGIPLCVICCFFLAAFNICSLCLIFVNLINMCLGGVLPWVYPVWDSLGFLDLGDYFRPHFRNVFNYYLCKYFVMALLSSSSGTLMIRMLGPLTLSWRSLRLSSFLLFRFSFFLSDSFISTILSSTSLILSSAADILFVASRVFLISFIVLYIDSFLFLLSLC